jgi:hypothetical protein
MKNCISFCVNACKKSTFRFIGGLQNVLRFLSAANNPCPYTSSLFLYIIRCIYYLLIIFVKLLPFLVEQLIVLVVCLKLIPIFALFTQINLKIL